MYETFDCISDRPWNGLFNNLIFGGDQSDKYLSLGILLYLLLIFVVELLMVPYPELKTVVVSKNQRNQFICIIKINRIILEVFYHFYIIFLYVKILG